MTSYMASLGGQMAEKLELGTGVYSVGDAARIIGRSVGRATPQQVRRWVRAGLSESVEVEGKTLLSFQDLVSIEMVSRFRGRGVSLQAIRIADQRIRRDYPELRLPFASSRFYTDGNRVWTRIDDKDDQRTIEIIGQVDQYTWQQALETFAAEITFSNGEATSWRPNRWVELNPQFQFGEPIVAGTRVPARTVMANLEVGSPSEVADWYGLSVEQVAGVKDYLAAA